MAADDVEPESAVPLERGEPAPFAGQLLPPWLALELADDSCPERRKADQVMHQEILRVRVDEQKALRESDKLAAAERERLLNDELDRQTSVQRQPWFVATITGAIIVTGLVLSMWGYNELRRDLSASSTTSSASGLGNNISAGYPLATF